MIENLIYDFVSDYVASKENIKTRWKKPLIAVAGVGDERFFNLKKSVGEFHLLPTDMLSDAKSVITYFLPFGDSVVDSNIRDSQCSKEWAYAYIETNILIEELNKHIISELEKLGYSSVSTPATHNYSQDELITNWSYRHIAEISGLGKMGANNILITDSGCCGRIGVLVTALDLPNTKENKAYRERCPYKIDKSCGICLEKCVNDSLNTNGFNRFKCNELLLENLKGFKELHPEMDCCGKCCVALPCSKSSPL